MEARERRDVRNAMADVLAGRLMDGVRKLEALLSPGEVTMVREQHRILGVPELLQMPVLYHGEAMYGAWLDAMESVTVTIYQLDSTRTVLVKIEDSSSVVWEPCWWAVWEQFDSGVETLVGALENSKWLRRACGPNDPRGHYVCDDCGRAMHGYHRVGDFALCARCEDEYSARERAALSAQQ